VEQPNQVYVGDITTIYTQEGWLYLAVVIDLFSRQVVGWSMAEHMRAKLVNDALLTAVWKRKPAKGLLWHTDRGSQYASESFFHTLKTELVHHQTYQTRDEAKQTVCLNILKSFTTASGSILLTAICRSWTTNCSVKPLNFVSGKVLTHHARVESLRSA
jgi:transposase InsO family protein